MRHRSGAFQRSFNSSGSGLWGSFNSGALNFFRPFLFLYLALISGFLYLCDFSGSPSIPKMLFDSLKGRDFEPSALKLRFKAETLQNSLTI